MKNSIKLLSVLALMLAGSAVNAAMIVTATSGGSSVTVEDNVVLGGDLSPTLGQIIQSQGAFNGWSFETTVSTSKPLISNPLMELNATAQNSTSTDDLVVTLTDTDFEGSYARLVSGVTTLNANVSVQGYVNVTNGVNPAFEQMIFDTSAASWVSSGSDGLDVMLDGPFSLTIVMTFNHEATGSMNTVAAIKVPVPATLALFGLGLLGLGWSRKKA